MVGSIVVNSQKNAKHQQKAAAFAARVEGARQRQRLVVGVPCYEANYGVQQQSVLRLTAARQHHAQFKSYRHAVTAMHCASIPQRLCSQLAAIPREVNAKPDGR
eukprot:816495-Pleurochrysis_carterae.AAC.4